MRLGFIILVFLLITKESSAQKFPIVSDSLKKVSDELPVKLGTQWMGKIYQIKFGRYSVTDSKMGWGKSTQKSKLFDRKVTITSNQKFSFKLEDGSGLATNTNVTNRIESEVLREVTYFSISGEHSSISITNDEELLMRDNQLNAIITITGDTTETWTFMMRSVEGSQVNGNMMIGSLTNGSRKFFLYPVSKGEGQFPGLGYTFVENSKELATLQFFGGGMLGANKNILWLVKDFDPKTKIILASTLTAVLQTKVGAMTF